MSEPAVHPEFDFTHSVIPRSDGSFLIKPGKPVLRESKITVKVAKRMLGVSESTIYRYVEEGVLSAKQATKKSRIWLFRTEVDALRDRDHGEE